MYAIIGKTTRYLALLMLALCWPPAIAYAAPGQNADNPRWITVVDSPAHPFTRVETVRAGQFLQGVTAYAEVLEEAHENTLAQLSFWRDSKLSPHELRFLEKAKFLQHVNDLGGALARDIEQNTTGSTTLLSSHTLEGIGRFGLDMIDFFELAEKPWISEHVQSFIGQAGGYRELLTGLAKNVGSGELNHDIVTHYVDGVQALAKAQLKRHGPLPSQFALIDGFQALASAGYQHSRGRRLDVDLVTEYLDAANNLAWTGLGMSACQGSHACTAAVQQFGTTSAEVLRDWTLPLFHQGVLTATGQGRKVVEDYLTLQQSQITRGQPVQPISAVYGSDLLRRNGLSPDHIGQLDAAAHSANHYYASGNRPGMTRNHGRDDLGGVDLSVAVPEIEEMDLDQLRRSVLERSTNVGERER